MDSHRVFELWLWKRKKNKDEKYNSRRFNRNLFTKLSLVLTFPDKSWSEICGSILKYMPKQRIFLGVVMIMCVASLVGIGALEFFIRTTLFKLEPGWFGNFKAWFSKFDTNPIWDYVLKMFLSSFCCLCYFIKPWRTSSPFFKKGYPKKRGWRFL